ncbi:hypothetical protein [Flavobacterium humi]|uniref:Uncharacterized protein n=1 Tax=Flavobacterium humi TaxID=2562683 RepID=A0A4Z0LAW6_9FLAO|nr:hypothetical protein [Flavobacterium humi]TGD58248.1 hypothetical protein E4635_09590 [Flavobacterium humi]
MALDANTGGAISLTTAQEYISEFQRRYPNEIKASFIGANNVNSLLVQNDCIGIRIYNGYDVKQEKMNQVLVGVDPQENDMRDLIMDDMAVCPPYCPINSILD